MNWKARPLVYITVTFFLLLSFWLGGFVFTRVGNYKRVMEVKPIIKGAIHALESIEEKTASPAAKLKKLEYEEMSPDRVQKSIEYKMTFSEQLYSEYYGDYFENQKIIAIKDNKSSKEYYVFTGGERTGDPHWLGNDYIFFTTNCGTSCQGLYLVDTRSKESRLAVISYLFENDRWVTYFQDWFDKKFVFEGLLDDIKSEMTGSSSVLIFSMEDDQGKFLGERKMLFTSNSLKSI